MMTQSTGTNPELLSDWLSAVNSHLALRRTAVRSTPRPKRNRERERARREARQLFAMYYQEIALARAA